MNYCYTRKVDESQNHYAIWKRLGKKEYTLYDSIHIKF